MPSKPPIVLGLLLVPLLGACMGDDFPSIAVAPEPGEVQPQTSAQFMLKFKDGRDEQAVRASLAQLSQVAGMDLAYVRPMSGEAHVLRFPAQATAAQIDQALRALQAMPEVEYAAPDRRVQQP